MLLETKSGFELPPSGPLMLVAHGEYFQDDSVSRPAEDFRRVPGRQVVALVRERNLLHVVLLK